jgi:hypothetical protein
MKGRYGECILTYMILTTGRAVHVVSVRKGSRLLVARGLWSPTTGKCPIPYRPSLWSLHCALKGCTHANPGLRMTFARGFCSMPRKISAGYKRSSSAGGRATFPCRQAAPAYRGRLHIYQEPTTFSERRHLAGRDLSYRRSGWRIVRKEHWPARSHALPIMKGWPAVAWRKARLR